MGSMNEIIYIKIFKGPSESSWKAVRAQKISESRYLILGDPFNGDSSDSWEFGPGSVVIAVPQTVESKPVLRAIRKVKDVESA